MRGVEELNTLETEMLDQQKFENWRQIVAALRERVKNAEKLQVEEIPSRSLLLSKSEFLASIVTVGARSMEGLMVDQPFTSH